MSKYQRQRKHLLSAIAVLTSILIFLSGVAYAKYVESEQFENQLVISADLGTITLNDTGADYQVIPGVDITKDASVTFAVNAIPVYVYLIVEADFTNDANGISYQLESCWTLVDGQTNVYVYSVDGVPVKVTNSTQTRGILLNDTIQVSQHVKENVNIPVHLNFTAIMKQAYGNISAKDIYLDSTNY